jgi:hypothetical protein
LRKEAPATLPFQKSHSHKFPFAPATQFFDIRPTQILALPALSSYVLQDNQLFDVPGHRQSPYQTHALLVAAPSREVASSRTVTFMLPRSLYVEYLAAS